MKGMRQNNFYRMLKTNYNYSVLVTLAMNLSIKCQLYKISNQIAVRNKIKKQKNYSIVVLRLALIIRQKKLTIQQVFQFLESNYVECINKKYKQNLSSSQINEILKNCKYNIQVFKYALHNRYQQEKKVIQCFCKLYNQNQSENNRHINSAIRLSKIVINVAQNHEDFAIKAQDLQGGSNEGSSQLSNPAQPQKLLTKSQTAIDKQLLESLIDSNEFQKKGNQKGQSHSPILKDIISSQYYQQHFFLGKKTQNPQFQNIFNEQ